MSRALSSGEDERTVTTSSLLCSATAQPLITAFVLVWAPILLLTLLSGFMVRDVAVAEERINGEVEMDENENLIISGVERAALAQLIRENVRRSQLTPDQQLEFWTF